MKFELVKVPQFALKVTKLNVQFLATQNQISWWMVKYWLLTEMIDPSQICETKFLARFKKTESVNKRYRNFVKMSKSNKKSNFKRVQ